MSPGPPGGTPRWWSPSKSGWGRSNWGSRRHIPRFGAGASTTDKVDVDLSWDFTNDRVALGRQGAEQPKGTLKLVENQTLTAGKPLTQAVWVKTGAFSAGKDPDIKADSATPGRKTIAATVTYLVKPATTTATTYAPRVHMLFNVRED